MVVKYNFSKMNCANTELIMIHDDIMSPEHVNFVIVKYLYMCIVKNETQIKYWTWYE